MDHRDDQDSGIVRRPQGSLSRMPGRHFSMLDPWLELEEMRRRMDALVGQFFGIDSPGVYGRQEEGPSLSETGAEPEVDVYESDDAFTIHAALPGVNPQDIWIEATQNSIQLTAEGHSPFRPEAPVQAAGQPPQWPHTQHRQSRYSRIHRFQFAYALPSEIDADAVKAGFHNGLLELHLPKLRPAGHRSVPIPIHADDSDSGAAWMAAEVSAARNVMPASTLAMHEGDPTAKMGMAYTPSGSEDHTTKAQSVGRQADTEHQKRQNNRDAGSVTTEQTSPLEPPAEAGAKSGKRTGGKTANKS